MPRLQQGVHLTTGWVESDCLRQDRGCAVGLSVTQQRWRVCVCAVSPVLQIVHCCGYDSVPFDLGVLLLADHARKQLNK